MKLKEEFLKQYKIIMKDEFHAFLNGFSLPRSHGLRLNPLKCTQYENNPYLKSILRKHRLVDHGFYYQKSAQPGRHPYHFAGVYYIQDPSAMMVIENADIEENDVVFDMCAAPGGKSTHILGKLNQTGLLISNDINNKRAKILSENIERMGTTNALVISTDPKLLNKDFYGYFDKVIVDAPCSGEGMFRKDEQTIVDWSLDKVKTCATIQKSLLDTAYHLVKENGLIIYSTCTFSSLENEEVIKDFLTKHQDVTILPTIKNNHIKDGFKPFEKCSRFYFHHFDGEGHFIAKMKKTAIDKQFKKTKSKSLKKASQEKTSLLNKYLDTYLNHFTLKHDIYDFNNHLYTLHYNKPLPNLDDIKIIRYGLHLGEIKKNRFEPSHALALALKPTQVKSVINFQSDCDEVIKYLSGETIYYPGNQRYTLLTVDNFSLGWVKQVNNVLKNYYPKGLRIKK